MELDVTMPEWALDVLGKEAEIVELSAHDLALLLLASKVEHTHEDEGSNEDAQAAG